MLAFFSKEDETRIIEAIRAAERNTSGEIRVHLEKKLNKDVIAEARDTFAKLGMHNTEARNGVLLFIAPEAHQFAIIGDEGIHQQVGEQFWQEERDLLQAYFRQGDFTEGICQAIAIIGNKLKAYFPYLDEDQNELPDDISYSKDV
jgi:uncharacterized membrane protein